MKGYTLLLLALAGCINAQYYYPQPSPPFNLPPVEPVVVPTNPPAPPPTTAPPNYYLPPAEGGEIQAVVEETPAPTPAPTTRPPPPPTTRPPPPPTTRPPPPPTTRPPPPPTTTTPPPPPPTTRPPPPPTTTRPPPPPPTTPPAIFYLPPVVETQAPVVIVTTPPPPPPTTRPPPPPTTRPPPPPTTRPPPPPTVAPVVQETVAPGYNYPVPQPEFPILPDGSSNQDQVLILVPTTQKPAPTTNAPVVEANVADAIHEEHHHHHDVPFWDFRESIPGEPGQDYPILDQIPTTKFSCNDRPTGYYADPEAGCQVYHICSPQPTGIVVQFSFLCPNGTIFNQESFACQWWTDVKCDTSEQFYALNANIGVVPEKPATLAPPAAPPAAPATNPTPLLAASSQDSQQVLILQIPNEVPENAQPSASAASGITQLYEAPSQLYGAPAPVAQASVVDTVGLKPPKKYRK